MATTTATTDAATNSTTLEEMTDRASTLGRTTAVPRTESAASQSQRAGSGYTTLLVTDPNTGGLDDRVVSKARPYVLRAMMRRLVRALRKVIHDWIFNIIHTRFCQL